MSNFSAPNVRVAASVLAEVSKCCREERKPHAGLTADVFEVSAQMLEAFADLLESVERVEHLSGPTVIVHHWDGGATIERES